MLSVTSPMLESQTMSMSSCHPVFCWASVAKRQSVWLGAERFRIRNSLEPTCLSLIQGKLSPLLGGPVRWECSMGRALRCKNEYLVLALVEETAMNARGYALHATIRLVCMYMYGFTDQESSRPPIPDNAYHKCLWNSLFLPDNVFQVTFLLFLAQGYIWKL